MDSSCLTFRVNRCQKDVVIDLGCLRSCLEKLPDKRKARGIRYDLVTVLLLIVLAKLAGEDRIAGIAEWVAYRADVLSQVFPWSKHWAPHRTTYSRILGQAIEVEEFERVVGMFLATCHQAQGSHVVTNIDGKTLRGTIPAGASRGQHLLAAFMPDTGLVLMQIEVDGKENEAKAAPRLLKCLDLRGKIITGDAALAQRDLSIQIVEAQGDYLWTVKGNQPQLQEDIATLFEPAPCAKGFSPGPMVFPTARTAGKRHGRIECRTLQASSALRGYLEWPYAEQVFKLERRVTRLRDGKVTTETAYGITSLSAQEASPKQLLALVRKHWQIENGLHYRRDETLREDWCHLRLGQAPRMMAAINNLVLGLLLPQDVRNVPQARRCFAAHFDHLASLLSFP